MKGPGMLPKDPKVQVTLKMPESLLESMDKWRGAESRQAFIRHACQAYMADLELVKVLMEGKNAVKP